MDKRSTVAKIYIAGSLSMIYIWLANSNDLFWMVWLNLRDTSWNLFESQNEITGSKFLLFPHVICFVYFSCVSVCLFVCTYRVTRTLLSVVIAFYDTALFFHLHFCHSLLIDTIATNKYNILN